MTANQSVHVSDIRTWLRCRQQHYFSSSLHLNLEPITPYIPFFLGRGIHEALQVKYETGTSAVPAFMKWAAAEMDRIDQRSNGLSDEESNKLQDQVVLGRGMLEHYELWQSNKPEVLGPTGDHNLEFIALELKAEHLPLRRPRFEVRGLAMDVVDDGIVIDFGLRMDGVVRRKDDGTYWILEHKTTRSIQELKQSLDNDLQCGMYCWAAQHILGVRVSGVLYNIMRKKLPTEAPTLAKGGALSQNKALDTTFEYYKAQLDGLCEGQSDEYRKEQYDAHKPMLQHLWDKQTGGGNAFFERYEVRRTQRELELLAETVGVMAEKMLDPDEPVYPSPLWTNCNFCSFKQPCLMTMRGADPTPLLEEKYRIREPYSEPAIQYGDEGALA